MPIPQLRIVRHGPSSYYTPRPPRMKLRRCLRKFFRKIIFAVFLLSCFTVVYLAGAFAWYSRFLPDPNKIIERNLSQSTKIYDREGKTILYDVHGEKKRTLVKLEEIPAHVKWATISAEDRYFYEHRGFNFLSMVKGVVIDPLLGRRMRGGSTITQQLVKNAILTGERKISRKIKEFILSYRIEKSFSKDEILQMYLNEIPYGSVSYGVQSASETYFQKDVKDISLAEAAILAALPKAPTYYSPFGSHKDKLFGRQQYILEQMAENGYITKEQALAAAKEDIKFPVKKESITAPHFVMYVKEWLVEKFGEELVENGGLKVITTLDMDKQKIAEEAVEKGVDERGKKYNFYNAALVSLDPKTGQILAMVGSKDYFDIEHDGNVNVTLSLRQPGSSIKPFIYLAAFLNGYTPNTVLYDVDTIFKTETKDYHPYNYDLKVRGPVIIRQALAGSLNIPAVKTIYLVGVQKVIDMLELFGYTSFEDRSRFGLSLVLGGGEVRLLEHAAAFAVLANEGVYFEPAAILRVEDSQGNVLLEFEEKKRQVAEKEKINWVTNILSDDSARAFIFGSAGPLTLPGRPVAAKTGTTNDNHDALAMGYTPSLVAGVWVGNNDNSEMKKGADGSIVAAPIWNEYMKKALGKTPVEQFPAIEIPTTNKPALDGVIMPEKVVKIDKFSKKLATEFTPLSAIEEKKFKEAHNILHYVYKDDPAGAAPDDPVKADINYTNWEAAVQAWMKKKMAELGTAWVNEQPPTEYDDVHSEANKPTIFIQNPGQNTAFSSSTLTAEISVSAPRGVSRVEYYLDKKLAASAKQPPFNAIVPISSYFAKGSHKLRAVAYDDVDNSNEAQVDIYINNEAPLPSVEWQFPTSGAVFFQNDFPLGLRFRLTDVLATQKLNIYQTNKNNGKMNLLGSIILPVSDIISIEWPKVMEKGEYGLSAEIIDPNGQAIPGGAISVIVK